MNTGEHRRIAKARTNAEDARNTSRFLNAIRALPRTWIRHLCSFVFICGFICFVLAAAPPRGSTAPALDLKDLDGTSFDAQRLAGRPHILIFGELFHLGTRDALAQVDRILNEPRFAGDRVTPILIVAQDVSPAELKRQAEPLRFAGVILHDPQRRAFGAYRVAVMPTVVVVDAKDIVVHSLPGMTARFGDILTDALLLTTGRLSEERFEETLHPTATTRLSEEQARADRTAQLARQLARRGLDEMAQEKYVEALKDWPNHASARLGLARLFLKRQRIAEAEAQFRAILAFTPDSVEAALGVAFVQTLRGGEELAEAERAVRDVIARDPFQPRAHYLLGLIHERRDHHADAAASFKRAAELLLERNGVN